MPSRPQRASPLETKDDDANVELSREQQQVIDLVAEHQLTRGAHITGIMLRSQLPGGLEAKHNLIESVVGLYLDPVQIYPEKHYKLTLRGWLTSKHSERVRRLMDGILQFFKQQFKADPDFPSYSWTDLKTIGLVQDDTELHFVSEILMRSRMIRGGGPNAWGRPGNIEHIVDVKDSSELIAHLSEQARQDYERNQLGRKRLEMALSPWDDDIDDELLFSSDDTEANLDFTEIFISHSNKDAQLAQAIVDCLYACMDLEQESVRCTSVPGHTLSPGDVADEVLRENLERCKVVIGLVTEESMKSGYVVMELGAGWGLRKVVCGVLAGKADFGLLPGPMSRLHSIKATSEEGIHLLLETIAKSTGRTLRGRAKCVPAVKTFVAAAKRVGARKKMQAG